MTDYSELRAAARAASAGEWSACGPSYGAPRPIRLDEVLTDCDQFGDEATICNAPAWDEEFWPERTANMDFIASAQPRVILALLDELEALRAAAKPKPKRATVPKFTYTPADEKVAQWMYEMILAVCASAKEPSWPTWANEIRMMREIDSRAPEEICELFKWANADSFWFSNILSPKKLREKWDMLTVRRGGNRQNSQLGKAGQSTARAAQDWMDEA